MTGRTITCDDNLELYLKQVRKIFDISRIVNKSPAQPQIIEYYLKNRLTYRLFYSWEGFYHSGISYDGKRKKGDLKEQARIIEGYIRDINATDVLELGCGLGPNSAFLAARNPHVNFVGVDLSNKPLKRFTQIPNLQFRCGDYHDLSNFEDDSYDVVFVIEALCYSTNKHQVLREVRRKLRKGGAFIIFDVYQSDRASPLNPSEEIMWELITKGVAANKFERVTDVESYMREQYSIAVVKDLSQCILPSFERQEALVRFYFSHPIVAKAANAFLPFDVVKNAVVVLLIPTSIRRQIKCYYLHVLKNDL
jgi:arsenite methyltransferase